MFSLPFVLFLALILMWPAGAQAAGARPVHAIAMHGKPALAAGFSQFPYVNGDAPQGGVLRQGVTGSFDSLNPFIIKGEKARGLYGNVFQGLMARNYDEPFSLYGLIAKRLDVSQDRRKVTFFIDPRARFSDGSKISASDVL
ncbi:MAG TPA: ABC transporter substrate-binding protein, partial [Rhizobiales bacterium]|nr:ABC transporter substrate-binding protein [Hyphomicrobiales bacterium]